MFKKVFGKIMGDPNERELDHLRPIVGEINALEPDFEALSDSELKARTDEFLKRAEGGETLESLLPEAFAAVREASKRTLGLRHRDVQFIGGIVLTQGKIAELKTGEGKTLMATLPLYLVSLLGQGAHLITPNDYLAKRDTQWMGPIYHLLGRSVAVIQSAAGAAGEGAFLYDPAYISQDDRYQNLRPIPRREAYRADITYGTNNEFGFDYLRDNMALDVRGQVQKPLHYAIVDEVDYILIDEARTPLIISGPAQEADPNYQRMAQVIPRLKRERDYEVEEKRRIVTLTEEGIERLEKMLGIDNLYSPENAALTPYVDNALRAYVLFQRDHHYVVIQGQVIIVDEFTGRMMHGRRYSEGLHQSIEAKEGVPVQRENLTLATITLQNYFRMYDKLAGMTATAATEAEEFDKIYELDVIQVPTFEPVIRIDHDDLVYKNQQAKFRTVVDEIVECHRQGQPVLVGTIAIETSEMLSEMLRRRGVKHEVLNAKQHEREAIIIAQAGRSGAVTIATNMAGRGVDIKLGGDPEGLARDKLRRQGENLTTIEPQVWQEALAESKAECEADRQKVLAAGGLHVIGTERHDARRIDNQLRGRSGRQGDPGSSRFYVALDDELMRRFGGQRVAGIMERFQLEDDIPIEHGLVSKSIETAQKKVEGYNFDIRKHVLEYDDVVNKQREVIYEQRQELLEAQDLRSIALDMAARELEAAVSLHTANYQDEWDLEGLYNAVRSFLPLNISSRQAISLWEDLPSAQDITQDLLARAEAAYDAISLEFGRDILREATRTGQRLVSLAENPGGLYLYLHEQAPHYLDADTLKEVERVPLGHLDKNYREKVIEALGLMMSRLRDKQVMLRTVDNLWVHHLTDLDNLREGIGLRAYGQQDPLVSYKREAHEMYGALLEQIQHDIVHQLFLARNVRVPRVRPTREMYTNVEAAMQQRSRRRKTLAQEDKKELGRNDPCWCGSGKKYKHCHMRQDKTEGGGGRSKRRKR
ncbi:MAG: preprotein translocase subunit SecA [Anaerolineaceae bacterium 4572_32.1]|nr:MAG: preprotein translocase subunit SecA [Anaerolineaceae bacterium 4572_32.1]